MSDIKSGTIGNSKCIMQFHPLTKDRWNDFKKLFGKRGACGGCWCMWWRLKRSCFEKCKGNKNREAMKAIVTGGQEPGILVYIDDLPVGWCAIGPREEYSVLSRSRILKPVDDAPVWSVVCFFVENNYRRQGLTVELLKAALAYAKRKGARIVEGYPIEPKKDPTPPAFAWTGFASAFQKAGFVECARRSPTRPIMRFYLNS